MRELRRFHGYDVASAASSWRQQPGGGGRVPGQQDRMGSLAPSWRRGRVRGASQVPGQLGHRGTRRGASGKSRVQPCDSQRTFFVGTELGSEQKTRETFGDGDESDTEVPEAGGDRGEGQGPGGARRRRVWGASLARLLYVFELIFPWYF